MPTLLERLQSNPNTKDIINSINKDDQLTSPLSVTNVEPHTAITSAPAVLELLQKQMLILE